MSTLAWVLIGIFVVCAVFFFAALFKVSSESSHREEDYYALHPPDRRHTSTAKARHQLDSDPNVNRCVCCGEIIPEGLQVCSSCEQKQRLGNGWY